MPTTKAFLFKDPNFDHSLTSATFKNLLQRLILHFLFFQNSKVKCSESLYFKSNAQNILLFSFVQVPECAHCI